MKLFGRPQISWSGALKARFALATGALICVSAALVCDVFATEIAASNRRHAPGKEVQERAVPETSKYRLGTTVVAGQYRRKAAAPISLEDRAPTSTSGWTTVYSNDFESGFPDEDWHIWRSEASAQAVWDDWTCWYGDTPDKSAGCAAGGSAAIGCEGLYPNRMDSWMVYGPFSLDQPGITAAELGFSFKLDCESEYDYFFAAASVDGDIFHGAQWTGAVAAGSQTLDLADVPDLGNLLGESHVWIAFIFQSDESTAGGAGAQVDDILIRADYPIGIPALQISALKNPGRTRALTILVKVSDGSGSAPIVTIGGTSIELNAIGNSVYRGQYWAASDMSSVTITATDTNGQGTGTEEVTVTF